MVVKVHTFLLSPLHAVNHVVREKFLWGALRAGLCTEVENEVLTVTDPTWLLDAVVETHPATAGDAGSGVVATPGRGIWSETRQSIKQRTN